MLRFSEPVKHGDGRWHISVYNHDNEEIGYVKYIYNSYSDHQTVYLNELIIYPPYRGQHFAHKILSCFKGLCQNKYQASWIKVFIAPLDPLDNLTLMDRLTQLYQANGFNISWNKHEAFGSCFLPR
ncbi:MAG: hypothetical protein ACOX0E_06555 [Syntrophomonadaceae bacterium]